MYQFHIQSSEMMRYSGPGTCTSFPLPGAGWQSAVAPLLWSCSIMIEQMFNLYSICNICFRYTQLYILYSMYFIYHRTPHLHFFSLRCIPRNPSVLTVSGLRAESRCREQEARRIRDGSGMDRCRSRWIVMGIKCWDFMLGFFMRVSIVQEWSWLH